MGYYSEAAMERAMKVQEVMLRAMGKRITWWQAAEILGMSCRSLRRWKGRSELVYRLLLRARKKMRQADT